MLCSCFRSIALIELIRSLSIFHNSHFLCLSTREKHNWRICHFFCLLSLSSLQYYDFSLFSFSSCFPTMPPGLHQPFYLFCSVPCSQHVPFRLGFIEWRKKIVCFDEQVLLVHCDAEAVCACSRSVPFDIDVVQDAHRNDACIYNKNLSISS